MIRIIYLSLVGIIALLPSILVGQDIQGIATYKSHRKLNLKIDDEKQTAIQMEIQAQLVREMQQEYTLKFNKESSIYKKEEQLAGPTPSSDGVQITISGDTDVRYKNTKENRYTVKKEYLGKVFLIKDELKPIKWVLDKATKNIGKYTCYKATFIDSITTTSISDKGEISEVKKERVTTAWYTPEIPVTTGPANYGGLPGLILEINDGSLTLICTKIVLNPTNKFEIDEPKKGKIVSQQEFDKIQKKKNKEMMDEFKSRRKGSGEEIFIIGG
ncbi:GLPGLI family protein [Flavobacteriaceae bacterium F08102]|nr:GLPGLI family protein [Flavobacteriaceae bacterium F08102]